MHDHFTFLIFLSNDERESSLLACNHFYIKTKKINSYLKKMQESSLDLTGSRLLLSFILHVEGNSLSRAKEVQRYTDQTHTIYQVS